MAKHKQVSSWLAYLQSLTQKAYDVSELVDQHIAHFLNIQSVSPMFFHSAPLTYLLDYTTGRYLTFSTEVNRVMGLDHGGLMEGGVEFMKQYYHPDHFRLFDRKIFDIRLNFLKSIPPTAHTNYIFSYNHRFKNTQGSYSDYLQRNCFIKSDALGNPLVSFGIIINYSHFVSPTQVVHTIEKTVHTPTGIHSELVDKKLFLSNLEDEELFSKREIEVLKWMSDGLTSKEIASRLFLSEHTIINHRRHMQEKSNIANATALISFALRKGII